MFGTPSPTAVAAAAAGTQVRTALWEGEGATNSAVLVLSWSSPHTLAHPGIVPRGSAGPCPSRDPAPSPCLCCLFLSQAWLWLLLLFLLLLPLLLLLLPGTHRQPLGVWFPQTSPQRWDAALSRPPPSTSCEAHQPPPWRHTQHPFNTPPHSPSHFGGPPPLSLFPSSGCAGAVPNFQLSTRGLSRAPFLPLELSRGRTTFSASPHTSLSQTPLSL